MSFEVDLRNSPGLKSLVRAGKSGYDWFSEYDRRLKWLRAKWLRVRSKVEVDFFNSVWVAEKNSTITRSKRWVREGKGLEGGPR